MVGFFSGFQDEEELEQWYADSKESLDAEFNKAIDGHLDNAPKAKERYSNELRKLIAKYQAEYTKLLPKILKRK